MEYPGTREEFEELIRSGAGAFDGDFYRVDDSDIMYNDVVYYPKLKGNISALKSLVVNQIGNLFVGFNSEGYIKSWTGTQSLTSTPGISFYYRINYPGWVFMPQKDAGGHDLFRIADVATIPAIIGVIEEKYTNLNQHNQVAGFNTQGFVKDDLYTITAAESLMPWQGLYYRTEYNYYEFFPYKDSGGGDYPGNFVTVGDPTIPKILAFTSQLRNPFAAGVNSNFYIKESIKIPPPNEPFKAPQEGIWVRVEWDGFCFLPGLDSNGNDVRQLKDASTVDLITEMYNVAPDEVVAFNTQGWLKSKLNASPNEQSDEAWGPTASVAGIYVRQWPRGFHPGKGQDGKGKADPGGTTPDDGTVDEPKLEMTLFVLKGTHQIWAKSFIADGKVRADYQKAVEAAANELMQQAKATGDYWGNGIKAVDMRNELLRSMRRRTSPLGLIVAKAYKPQGGTAAQYMNKVSQDMYKKPFNQLTATEAANVAGGVIKSAGRANKTFSEVANGLSKVGKGLMVIGIAASIYQVTVADDWKYELGKQISSWSGAIAGGTIGAGYGALLGPVGAVLGGLAGAFIGSLASEGAYSKLAQWFFGGSSEDSTSVIFSEHLDLVRTSVVRHIKESTPGKAWHIHQVLSVHHEALLEGDLSVIDEMVRTPSIERSDDLKVVATIVWCAPLNETTLDAYNPGSPPELVKLMDWAQTHFPSDE